MKHPMKFKPRHYLHFDEPISNSHANRLVTDPKAIKSRAFWPLIQFVMSAKRVKRDKISRKLEKSTKERPICYCSHVDAVIYSYYGKVLSELYEAKLNEFELEDVVTAFRPDCGKCNIHYAAEVFERIYSQESCVVLAFDIEKFFDTLDHELLRQQWADVLNLSKLPDDHYAVFKSLTKFTYVSRDDLYKLFRIKLSDPKANGRKRICTPKQFRQLVRGGSLIKNHNEKFGIPQGTPMSAVLSNIYMLEFDKAVNAKVLSVGGMYRRYCDDMLCIVPIDKLQEIKEFVECQIALVKLKIQSKKTTLHIFERENATLKTKDPLQYLGFNFDGERILLRVAGLSRYHARVRGGVKLAMRTKTKSDYISAKSRRVPVGIVEGNPIRRKKLINQYSYLGKRNYISYAMRASKLFENNNVGKERIRKQVRSHWGKLNEHVENANASCINRAKELDGSTKDN